MRRWLASALVVLVACLAGWLATAAGAAAGKWTISDTVSPTTLVEAQPASYLLTVVNGTGSATSGKIEVSDTLPAGVKLLSAKGEAVDTPLNTEGTLPEQRERAPLTCGEPEGQKVTCAYERAVGAGDVLIVEVSAEVEAGAAGASLEDDASVRGGGLEEAVATRSAQVVKTQAEAEAAAPFGMQSFDSVLSSQEAGAHPNLTTAFWLNARGVDFAAGAPKTLTFDLPPGLIGDPSATERCKLEEVVKASCGAGAMIGVAAVGVNVENRPQAEVWTEPVYNIVPYKGEPAAFAFDIGGKAVVRLDASLIHVEGENGRYAVQVAATEVNESEPVLWSTVTFWGVPAEHNGPGADRTSLALDATLKEYTSTPFGGPGSGTPTPFLSNPTRCGAEEAMGMSATSWAAPSETLLIAPAALGAFTECEGVPFHAEIGVKPTTFAAGRPSGYKVGLTVPRSEAAGQTTVADVRDVTVTMPPGTAISPSAANGLRACTSEEFGLASAPAGQPLQAGHCPAQSRIGSVSIATPLLPEPLSGSVYLGQPECDPCTAKQAEGGKMVSLLLEAEARLGSSTADGVVVKLAGKTAIDKTTGQLTTTFEENPQLPFDALSLELENGPDAPLVNPTSCGPVHATAKLTPWSGTGQIEAETSALAFEGCAPAGFTPSLSAGMSGTPHAGAFSPFAVTIARPDGQQALSGVTIHTPPGLLGMLSTVQLCGEAQANVGECPAASQIGTTTAVVGPGTAPYTIEGGRVYLTEHYGGGAFGLSIVVPAQAGPFHLAGQYGTGAEGDGNVVVRGSISVNPSTAALTIATNPMPEKLDGIPLSIDQVIVNIDRQGFMFNPTDCNAMSVTGAISSWSGTAFNVSTPFQAHDCASLAFKPSFSVSTQAKVSRKDGASLKVMITQKPGEANLHKVDVQLPKILPSRDETLKLACSEKQFNANPAACPAESKVGTAIVHTPVLNVPLKGPAILVSRGGFAFPSLDLVLQADERGGVVTIIAEGRTQIKKVKGSEVTFSRFETIPDTPISSVELNLPEGRYSVLGAPAAKGSLCGKPLVMPTTIEGQNGALIQRRIHIKVKGCSKKLSIRSRRVKRRTLILKLYVPGAGRLKISGKGLSSKTRKVNATRLLTVKVRERHAGKLKTKVKIRFTPSAKHAKPQTKRLAVRFK